jgi:hypothetical protein
MKALIISLNFNPGHFSHLVANYKLLEDLGFTSYLYIHPQFNQMDEENEFRKINYPAGLSQIQSIRVVIFWFPSLKNIKEAIRFKYKYKSQIIYIYHEPFDSFKNYYNSGFSIKKIVKIWLINIVNILMLFLANNIILSSNRAYSLYNKKYKWINKKFSLLPLMFDDETNGCIESIEEKKYISYIGTVAADHAFINFVNFVETCLTKKWFPGQTFLIATSSVIPEYEKSLIASYLATGRIIISEGAAMSNKQINKYYSDSIVVWNAYNRSMQSGVLPKAYMFGAAVVVQSKMVNEFVDNNRTGVSITDNENVEEIKNAIEEIISRESLYIKNCRQKFLDVFYYKGKLTEFSTILKEYN